MRRVLRHWPALPIGAVAVANAIVVAAIFPPFHAPDEQTHFDYVQRLGEDRRLPDVGACTAPTASAESHQLGLQLVAPVARRPDRPLPIDTFRPPDSNAAARATGGCSAVAYPPVYYATAALAYRFALQGSVVERLHAARAASVVWGAAGAILAYFAGVWFFARRADGALLGLAFALEPMIVFVSGVVNSDAAALAAAAGCWAALAALVRGDEPRRALVALGALALLGVQTKPTFTLCLPIFASGCVLALGARRLASWGCTALVFLPAAAAEVAWRIHVWAPTASGLSGGGIPLSVGRYLRSALQPARLLEVWINEYWMTWGWLDLRLPLQHYRALAAFLLLAGVGLCLAWRTLDRTSRAMVAFTGGSTLLLVAMLMGLEYAVIRRTPQPSFLQGRYLLTLFPPHAAAAVIGLRGVSDRFVPRLDGAWTLPLLLVALDVAALAALFLRFYHA